jgi:hypothetical protein
MGQDLLVEARGEARGPTLDSPNHHQPGGASFDLEQDREDARA